MAVFYENVFTDSNMFYSAIIKSLYVYVANNQLYMQSELRGYK